jgi:predicted helicase
MNQRRYQQHYIFANAEIEHENRMIWVKVGTEIPMFVLMSDRLVDLLPQGGSQCFPFYVYDKAGKQRRENITDWALAQFQKHYKSKRIKKWDIFHFVYGLLHHPRYREKYADNLKRELPRIPFAPDFGAFQKAGEKLAKLHLEYEALKPYKLKEIETPGVPLSHRVEKMKLTSDKTAVVVNPSLTLAGIPSETFEYRLGNRSALDWVIDQYRVTEDKRSGIVSNPNRDDDPEYIVRLVGQVVRVSVETMAIVKALPAFA